MAQGTRSTSPADSSLIFDRFGSAQDPCFNPGAAVIARKAAPFFGTLHGCRAGIGLLCPLPSLLIP